MTRLAPLGVVIRSSSDRFVSCDPEVAVALRFIHRQGHRPIQVTDVVRAVGLSRRSLERRFRTEHGRTVWQAIHDTHLELARQGLAETDLRIEQVAAISGFASAVYMAAAFRKSVGMTPRDFRTQYRGC